VGYLRKVANEWRAIGRRAPLIDRRALRRAYCKVQLTYVVAVRLLRLQPRRARVLGIRFRLFDYAAFAMMFEEIFAREEYRFEPGPAPVILDCGANIGVACAWFKTVAPGSRVTCFEPDPQTAAVLRENVARNGWTDVEVVEAALAAADGEADLFGEPGSPLQTTRGGAGARRVRTVRLSPYVTGEVDLLKLDVEGAERAVTAELAASGALVRVRRLAMEVNHLPGEPLSELLRPLDEAGFTYALWAPNDPPLEPARAQNLLIVAQRR